MVAYHILQSGASCRLPKTPRSKQSICLGPSRVWVYEVLITFCAAPFSLAPRSLAQHYFDVGFLFLMRCRASSDRRLFFIYRKPSITGTRRRICSARTAPRTSTRWATSRPTRCKSRCSKRFLGSLYHAQTQTQMQIDIYDDVDMLGGRMMHDAWCSTFS